MVSLGIALAACSSPTSLGFPDIATIEPTVVQVSGIACDFNVFGTGFFVAPDLVATNAHVVAGATDLKAIVVGDRHVGLRLVAIDTIRDIALLRTVRPALNTEVAPLAPESPVDGDLGLVAVFSRGGKFVAIPYEVRDLIVASTADIYGAGDYYRQAIDLDTTIQPGDSGAGLFDDQGRIVGIAFASSNEEDGVTYAVSVNEIRDLMNESDTETTVSSGSCY